MCGIAGFAGFKNNLPNVETLLRMLYAIRHRGPDATGIYIDDYAALGHVRLSIIDIDGGNQPIHNEDGTVWVSYNGEIYNYPELRTSLEKKGHRFSTESDTEVLVHLYEEYGFNFLHKLNGQWAFAIWDSVRKRLFITRDRCGIRPVYYAHINGMFIFASTIKALFQVPQIPREIDPVGIDQVFTFWTTLSKHTIYKDIQELPAGSALALTAEGTKIWKYWDMPLHQENEWFEDDIAIISEKIREVLCDAVKIRLRADVPVGTYLSGGLDSSGITSIVAKNFNPDVFTFGIRFSNDHFDESSFQQEMVKFLDVQHREIRVDDAMISDHFIETVAHCEKPLLRTAPVPLYLLSKEVRDAQIKVVLTGEGADEFHGGYDVFKEALVRRFWGRYPESPCRGKLIGRLYPDIFRDERTRKATLAFFKRGIEDINDPLFSHRIRWNNTMRLKTFLHTDLLQAINSYDAVEDFRNQLPSSFNRADFLQKAQYIETSLFLSNYLLSSQGDRMGMAHSIEVRMPFLDYRLIEMMSRVPSWMKMCGLDEKHVLKKALSPYLPKSITARKKYPYRAPIYRSLLSLLDNSKNIGIFNTDQIARNRLLDTSKLSMLVEKLKKNQGGSEMDAMALAGCISLEYLGNQFPDQSQTFVPDWYRPVLFVDKRTV